MSSVQTYVFFDIETTGLPTEENNKTKITELSLVAVKREHLLDCGLVPRVQHKITLCVNPERMIQPESTRITGLDNFLLEHESSFNMDVFTILNTFLNRLNKPVCLVAHNGHMFDFPILKTQLLHLGVSLSQNVMCVDSLHCFYEIMEEMKTETTNSDVTKIDKNDICDHDLLQMQLVNETTPRRQRRIDNDASLKTFKSHKRSSWAKRGLLVLTGMLWGCTNPFIRQGTKGLRDVRANTFLGRAYAEVVFLLGNWKYVVPWLINQIGSLVYLIVVQRVPLSLAVPAANSLAFAFTALTGSIIGAEETLDSDSIIGIMFIGIGTALCCWDKT